MADSDDVVEWDLSPDTDPAPLHAELAKIVEDSHRRGRVEALAAVYEAMIAHGLGMGVAGQVTAAAAVKMRMAEQP